MNDSYFLNTSFAFMPNNPFPQPKALIIDDETDICFLLSNILKQRNYKTTFAGSLAEADEILKADTGHTVIFLDNHLPDGLGVHNISRLKKMCPSTPIVMITAHDTTSDREIANAEGVDFFIGKPFSKEVIFKAIESLDE